MNQNSAINAHFSHPHNLPWAAASDSVHGLLADLVGTPISSLPKAKMRRLGPHADGAGPLTYAYTIETLSINIHLIQYRGARIRSSMHGHANEQPPSHDEHVLQAHSETVQDPL